MKATMVKVARTSTGLPAGATRSHAPRFVPTNLKEVRRSGAGSGSKEQLSGSSSPVLFPVHSHKDRTGEEEGI